jgi:hypothetical protein
MQLVLGVELLLVCCQYSCVAQRKNTAMSTLCETCSYSATSHVQQLLTLLLAAVDTASVAACVCCQQSASDGVGSMCSGDDWDCYNTAQRALISLINASNNHYNSGTASATSSSSSSGSSSSSSSKQQQQQQQHPSCTVVITGDYHYGDIKRMHNGPGTAYADWLGTADIARPLMQVLYM